MKRGLLYLFLLLIFLGVIAILLWHFNFLKLQESEVYQPSQEFQPAFEALEANSPVDNPEYDIEETVRAMNALEVAQCQSEDFISYLEYVARQDFSRVAPEVLEQKKKLEDKNKEETENIQAKIDEECDKRQQLTNNINSCTISEEEMRLNNTNINICNDNLKKLREMKNSLSINIGIINRDMRSIENTSDVCPTCNQKYNDESQEN